MPDWSENTSELKGRAPLPEGRFPKKKFSCGDLLRAVCRGAARLIRWIVLTVLLSAGLTALLNAQIRELLRQAFGAG